MLSGGGRSSRYAWYYKGYQVGSQRVSLTNYEDQRCQEPMQTADLLDMVARSIFLSFDRPIVARFETHTFFFFQEKRLMKQCARMHLTRHCAGSGVSSQVGGSATWPHREHCSQPHAIIAKSKYDTQSVVRCGGKYHEKSERLHAKHRPIDKHSL
jgi:hypothetical protein